MLEKHLQKQIINYLKSQDIYHFKIISCNKNGIPDLCIIHQGLTLFVEIKRPGGKLSKLQKYQMDLITQHGGKAIKVESLEEIKQILNKS